MFVEKLTNEDYLELCKLMLKSGYPSYKICFVEDCIYRALDNKKMLKELMKNTSKDMFIINEDKLIKSNSLPIGFSNDYKAKDYSHFSYYYLRVCKSLKRFYSNHGGFFINDFDIRWQFPYDKSVIDIDKFYKFMYKKFGEEYITALKEFNEKESKAKLEHLQKEADMILEK